MNAQDKDDAALLKSIVDRSANEVILCAVSEIRVRLEERARMLAATSTELDRLRRDNAPTGDDPCYWQRELIGQLAETRGAQCEIGRQIVAALGALEKEARQSKAALREIGASLDALTDETRIGHGK